MAALAKDRSTPTRHPEGGRRIVSYPVKAATTIFKGSLVSLIAGFAKPSADAASEKVMGVALEQVVNTGADGAKRILVACGAAFKLNVNTVTAAAVGTTATVSDDNTVTLAATSVNDQNVGMIEELESDGAWVYIGPTA